MTPDESFLADIIDHPEDDAPRLIYADWLDEHGDEARAEFIRLQIRLAHFPTHEDERRHPGPVRQAMTEALRRRERELVEAHGPVWLEQTYCLPIFWSKLKGYGWQATPNSAIHALFHRGFVTSVTLTLAGWCGEACWWCEEVRQQFRNPACPYCNGTGRTGRHGPALVLAAPLEQVTLSDRTPWNPRPGRYWWFNASEPPSACGGPDSCRLPAELMQHLPDTPSAQEGFVGPGAFRAWRTDTEAKARDALSRSALSRSALSQARLLTGLPGLTS